MMCSTGTSHDSSYASEITQGLEDLVSLAECLPYAKRDQGKHEEMKRQGKCAVERMEAAKQALEDQKKASDYQSRDLCVKKKKLEDEEKENERKLVQLEIHMEHNQQVHLLLKDKLLQAEHHLDELVALQKKTRKEEKCSKMLTAVSLVVLPVCTLLFSTEFFREAFKVTDIKELFLSGAVVTIICSVSMYVAQKAVLKLQKTISQYKIQVSDYKQELYVCVKETSEITKKIQDIQDSQEKIKETRGEISEQKKWDELPNQITFVSKLIDKVHDVNLKIEDPSDFEDACVYLNKIHQLVQTQVEKGTQGNLSFLDRGKIKIEKLKCGSKA